MSDTLKMIGLITGYWLPRAIHSAAKLSVADHLNQGPLSLESLAQKTQSHGPTLQRLLRALASEGLFAETAEGHFENTQLSSLLAENHPQSLKHFALFHETSWHWQAWGVLTQSVQKGPPVFEREFGQTLFRFLEENPSEAHVFNGAMTDLSKHFSAFEDFFDFSQFTSALDVGGGRGELMCRLLQKNPKLKGAVYELDYVVSKARELYQGHPLSSRLQFLSGSFFDQVPAGFELYLMKYILHDFDDEKCHQILLCLGQAMKKSDTLLVIENVLSAGNSAYRGKWTDLEMLALTPGGRERSEKEWRELFLCGGFRLDKIIATASPLYLLVAKKF